MVQSFHPSSLQEHANMSKPTALDITWNCNAKGVHGLYSRKLSIPEISVLKRLIYKVLRRLYYKISDFTSISLLWFLREMLCNIETDVGLPLRMGVVDLCDLHVCRCISLFSRLIHTGGWQGCIRWVIMMSYQEQSVTGHRHLFFVKSTS